VYHIQNDIFNGKVNCRDLETKIKGGQIFILGNIDKSSGEVKRLVKNKDLIRFTPVESNREKLGVICRKQKKGILINSTMSPP